MCEAARRTPMATVLWVLQNSNATRLGRVNPIAPLLLMASAE